MDVHQNARLTPHCRALLVDRVMQGRAKHSVAAEFGITVKTLDKWLDRYRTEGPQGLTVASWACVITSPNPTPRAPMAKPNALSRARCANWPMRVPTLDRTSASPPCRAGCTDTTGIGRTRAWQDSLQSPDSGSTGTTC
jgi:hypothetical protein